MNVPDVIRHPVVSVTAVNAFFTSSCVIAEIVVVRFLLIIYRVTVYV